MTDPARTRALLATWPDWRAGRDEGFREPYGTLSLTSLHWIDAEPASVPEVPGRWRADDDGVLVTASTGDGLSVSGVAVEGSVRVPLKHKTSGRAVTAGDVVVEVIERDGKYALRTRDPHAPALAAFTGVPSYEPAARWIVTAAWEPYDAIRPVRIASVVDGVGHDGTAAGVARFTVDDVEHTLTVFGSGTDLYVLFRDETSGVTTNAAARYLDVPAPEDGRLLLDFNRASNLPCAFNAFSTCPVPPPENRLALAVEAGEKKPA